MKKFLLSIFFFIMLVGQSWAATYYVATTGNDTTGTGAIGAYGRRCATVRGL